MHLPRTYLFVPGDRPDRFAKALAAGADAVVVDLEDAVAPTAKDTARAAVARWLDQVAERARIVVRINDETTPWFEADLQLLRTCNVSTVMLPKAERATSISQVCAACPDAVVLPLVETAQGMLAAQALAAAPGVQRLVFGTIDYALDLDLGSDAVALDAGHAHLALVSRAARIAAPVAGVTTAIGDETSLLADFARARTHGFAAKLCIHPQQVVPIHAALAPSEAEQVWARRVLAAAEHANGAVQVDGRMVDKPVIERARRIVGRCL